MASPSFFVEDEWIGCTSNPCFDGTVARFEAIGDDNRLVSQNQYSFPVERPIRFQLTREWEDGRFELFSSHFQTQAFVQRLVLVVHWATGLIKIARKNSHVATFVVLREHGRDNPFWCYQRSDARHLDMALEAEVVNAKSGAAL